VFALHGRIESEHSISQIDGVKIITELHGRITMVFGTFKRGHDENNIQVVSAKITVLDGFEMAVAA